MLNEVLIEGIVVRRWHYGSAEFVKLAVYADPGRLRERPQEGRDTADYVTLRCEGPLALAATTLKSGQRVRAAGVLISRDYDIPLHQFVARARGDTQKLREQLAEYGEIAMPHTLNEIIVERLTTADNEVEARSRPASTEKKKPVVAATVAVG